MFKFIDKRANGPGPGGGGGGGDLSCFILMNTCAKESLQTLQTLQIMCRSVFHLFIICRNTSLRVMKAVASATD